MGPVALLAQQPTPVAPGVRPVEVHAETAHWQQRFLDYTSDIQKHGVSKLDGYNINLGAFQSTLPKCVSAGLVSAEDATFVLHGLEHGFDLSVNHDMLKGRRVHKNYNSAYDEKEKVTKALAKRVHTGKTLKLGAFSGNARDLPPGSGIVVPMGSVAKKLQPDDARPISDHTKTGLNAAADTSGLQHTLDTYNEIARELHAGYFMRVEDVDGAFPNLPLAPVVWKYMYVWWYDVDKPLAEQSCPNTLYVHTFADFGSSPLPGIWDKFYRCVKAMAAFEGILTLPMPHFVDDNSLIGEDRAHVDDVAVNLGAYFARLGVPFKASKSRHAALRQLVLGFWWDSVERTRTLEAHKLEIYYTYFKAIAAQHIATLHELQVLVGRMHRAIMTMPPGSNIFLARVLPLLSGLKLPWHRRKLTAGARADILSVVRILESNMGRGYFDHSHMPWAPAVYSDAMKDGRVAGWGWCSFSGHYDFGLYGASDRRQCIDALEGDAVLRAAKTIGHLWRKKRVPFYIDSSSFQLSFVKGRSRAERLNGILRELYALSVQLDCIFVPIWISTHANVGADALSRNDFIRFEDWAKMHAPAGLGFKRCSHSS